VNDDRDVAANEHASRVRDMFAAIAGQYDFLNHLLSVNMDQRWRRVVARRLRGVLRTQDLQILDVACGTGDLSLALFETIGARIVGTDFCRPMLRIAIGKASRADRTMRFIEADALCLPFLDGSFDAATIAFGLRNLSNVERGLKELLRIIRPGGTVAVLEFSKPVGPAFSRLFQIYFTNVLPIIGRLVSGSRHAYQYLPDSVSKFADQEQLALLMRQAGFTEVEYENLSGGIAALHLGKRPNTGS